MRRVKEEINNFKKEKVNKNEELQDWCQSPSKLFHFPFIE
jgi:hypothetical protein